MYRNRMKYFSNKVFWTLVCFTPFIIEPGWTFCSLFIYCYEWCIFGITVYFEYKTFIFWNSITNKSRSSMFGHKSISWCTSCLIYCNSNLHYHRYSYVWTNILSVLKVTGGFCHKALVVVWCFIPENLWCGN